MSRNIKNKKVAKRRRAYWRDLAMAFIRELSWPAAITIVALVVALAFVLVFGTERHVEMTLMFVCGVLTAIKPFRRSREGV